jgi:hypothetical protein
LRHFPSLRLANSPESGADVSVELDAWVPGAADIIMSPARQSEGVRGRGCRSCFPTVPDPSSWPKICQMRSGRPPPASSRAWSAGSIRLGPFPVKERSSFEWARDIVPELIQ